MKKKQNSRKADMLRAQIKLIICGNAANLPSTHGVM